MTKTKSLKPSQESSQLLTLIWPLFLSADGGDERMRWVSGLVQESCDDNL